VAANLFTPKGAAKPPPSPSLPRRGIEGGGPKI